MALEIAALPDQIRGYEKIKERSMRLARTAAADKLAALEASGGGWDARGNSWIILGV